MGVVVKCTECKKDADECKCRIKSGLPKDTNKMKVKIKKLHEDAVIPEVVR